MTLNAEDPEMIIGWALEEADKKVKDEMKAMVDLNAVEEEEVVVAEVAEAEEEEEETTEEIENPRIKMLLTVSWMNTGWKVALRIMW